jgi:hypothetical protein
MNYYEELGLPPTADQESIRKIHRTLSKLLHPDQQTDPAIRRAAEIQMQRLNGVVAILLDPNRRRQYDESLASLRRPVGILAPAFSRSKELWRTRLGNQGSGLALLSTVAVGIALTVSALWIFAGDLMRFGTAAEAPPAPAVSVSSPIVAKPVVHHATPAIAKSALAGLWVLPPSPAKDEGPEAPMYVPESIELNIHAVDDNLTGEYIARYRTPGESASPVVQFAFAGRSSLNSHAFEWRSDDGSRGTVSLKPLGAASMRVDWRVTEGGSSMDVNAGTAVLIRKAVR